MKTMKKPALMPIVVRDVSYHRNGVSGNGFHLIRFTYKRNEMIATVFDGEGNVAVLGMAKLSDLADDQADNKWRGDWFEATLRQAILDNYEEKT